MANNTVYGAMILCILVSVNSYGMLAVPPQNRTIGRDIVFICSTTFLTLTTFFAGVCSILNLGSIISETSGMHTPFAGCGIGSIDLMRNKTV